MKPRDFISKEEHQLIGELTRKMKSTKSVDMYAAYKNQIAQILEKGYQDYLKHKGKETTD